MNEIYTERLFLRNVIKDDCEGVFEYSQCEEVGKNAGWKPHESIEETYELYKILYENQPYTFSIFLNDTKKLIGTAGLIDDPKREYDGARMLCYSIGKDYWGKGYMTESAKAIIKFGFENAGLDVISAYCYPYNERSKRVLEKCGMMYEGNLQKCEWRYDGVLLDNELYSITKEEYFAKTII